MIRHYVDASAWVKLYIQEPGTAWMKRLAAKHQPLVSATLGLAETSAAVARGERDGRLNAAAFELAIDMLLDDVELFSTIDLTVDVAERAVSLARVYELRGADAVHLASALTYRDAIDADDDVAIVTSDAQLAAAARHAGFPVRIPEEEERKR